VGLLCSPGQRDWVLVPGVKLLCLAGDRSLVPCAEMKTESKFCLL
jgi:hypothetical protein